MWDRFPGEPSSIVSTDLGANDTHDSGVGPVSRTTTLREQHDALLALAGEIGNLAGALNCARDAERLFPLLRQLGTILTAHLVAEDRILYPEMLASNDRRTAALASRFCEEMGGLTRNYACFSARWTSPDSLAADPDGFWREWAALCGALTFRIQRENAELYPLADAANEAAGEKAG